MNQLDGLEPSNDCDHLLYLLGGKHRAQALSTAAAIGLADQLAAAQPATAAELAEVLACNTADLESLMRLLAGLGFLDEPEPDRFALTRRGRTLCRDSLGPLAAFLGTPEQWDPWSRLRIAMRKSGGAPGTEVQRHGEPRPSAFALTFGTGLYDYLAGNQAAAAQYDLAIDAFTAHEARALQPRLDLRSARCIVDVGGGRGTLLLELLRAWPHLHGILFDLPHVVEQAKARLANAMPGRIEVAAGDFFDDLPNGADVYLIKHVLHNWDDERAAHLLSRCVEVMAENGRVVVIDAVLAPDNRADLARMLDLEMRVLTGGRERRKPELRRLFASAGLSLEQIEPLTGGNWLLVGRRRAPGDS